MSKSSVDKKEAMNTTYQIEDKIFLLNRGNSQLERLRKTLEGLQNT